MDTPNEILKNNVGQHIYTLERKGLFKNNAGFDSIAKTANLQNSFVVQNLQPLCFYEVPAEINEKPEVFVLSHPDEKNLIVTRSTFVPHDYSGQRCAHFSHQFIFSDKLKDAVLEDISRALYIDEFSNSWDIEKKEIEERRFIKFSEKKMLYNNFGAFFLEQKLDKKQALELYSKLIFAVFFAIKNNGKIFLTFPGSQVKASKKAIELVKLIYFILPNFVKTKMGLISFTPTIRRVRGVLFECISNSRTISKILSDVSDNDVVFDFSKFSFGENVRFSRAFVADNGLANLISKYYHDTLYIRNSFIALDPEILKNNGFDQLFAHCSLYIKKAKTINQYDLSRRLKMSVQLSALDDIIKDYYFYSNEDKEKIPKYIIDNLQAETIHTVEYSLKVLEKVVKIPEMFMALLLNFATECNTGKMEKKCSNSPFVINVILYYVYYCDDYRKTNNHILTYFRCILTVIFNYKKEELASVYEKSANELIYGINLSDVFGLLNLIYEPINSRKR